MTPDYLDPVDLAAEIEGVKKSCFNAHDRYTCLWNGLAEIEHEFVKALAQFEDEYLLDKFDLYKCARLLIAAREEVEK